MNKQYKNAKQRGIEWTDYTWNPVAGCKHACRWTMPDGSVAICYAEAVAESLAQSAYPNGFQHHYWFPKRLKQPFEIKKPARIFLDSMSDLMGSWVKDSEIIQVLEICREAHWHTFQLLTKNASRLLDWNFPPNVWVGVSAPPSEMFGKQLTSTQQKRMVNRQLSVLENTKAVVKWMSIEPLSFDIAPLFERYKPLDWFVIGAATNGNKTYQPEREWVENVLAYADKYNVPVFFKGNLKWDGRWREEFPKDNDYIDFYFMDILIRAPLRNRFVLISLLPNEIVFEGIKVPAASPDLFNAVVENPTRFNAFLGELPDKPIVLVDGKTFLQIKDSPFSKYTTVFDL